MKPILPEEQRELKECAKEIDRLISDTKWIFKEQAQEDLVLSFQNCSADILVYRFSQAADFQYFAANDNKYAVSFAMFADFSSQLLSKILQTEGAIHEKSDLEAAIGAINTMLHREDFLVGPSDPCDWWFPMQYHKVLRVHEQHRDRLPQFPIRIFERQDYFASKEILERAKQMIETVAEGYDGKTLCIENMHRLTTGFRNKDGNALLFDPITIYHTNDEKSHQFKSQLKKYVQK